MAASATTTVERDADIYDVRVCSTCVVLHANGANGESGDIDAERAHVARMSACFGGRFFIMSLDGDDTDAGPEPHFSYSECDICGDHLAGDRYDATVTVP